jgi:hypothetical protein
MTEEIARETFDKFHTFENRSIARAHAWFWRLLGYDTTIEHTYVPRMHWYKNENPFADYYTVFGLKREEKTRFVRYMERIRCVMMKITHPI